MFVVGCFLAVAVLAIFLWPVYTVYKAMERQARLNDLRIEEDAKRKRRMEAAEKIPNDYPATFPTVTLYCNSPQPAPVIGYNLAFHPKDAPLILEVVSGSTFHDLNEPTRKNELFTNAGLTNVDDIEYVLLSYDEVCASLGEGTPFNAYHRTWTISAPNHETVPTKQDTPVFILTVPVPYSEEYTLKDIRIPDLQVARSAKLFYVEPALIGSAI